MRIASGPSGVIAPAHARLVVAFALLSLPLVGQPAAAEPAPPMTARIEALIPDLEAYIASGMSAFDVPGVAIGIITGDRLVYGKGFGVRSKGGAPVDTRTAFQIGSTTKAFLATTMAITVDREKFRWDDRVVDLDPDFQLMDPWVTREFRVFDLMAQRSGLPPYANDAVGMLGRDQAAMIRSLRDIEPVTSFRSTFAYTNITHLLAARIVAGLHGTADWNTVAKSEILDPLGMKDTTFTADAMNAAANHSEGYRWTPSGTVEVPFDPIFPYGFGAAGDINSTIEDMARWVRLQLGDGSFEGRTIVSPENLAVTRTPKVAITDKVSYALGWIVQQTPNGSVVWHNGGTSAFGAYVGMLVDRDVGVIVLTNEENVGFPDAIGAWVADRLLDNPPVDHVANTLEVAKTRFEAKDKLFARPESPRPFPPLAPLAGSFSNPSFGPAEVRVDGNALVMELQATGAQLKLAPWDGEVFTASLMPLGRFAGIAENLGPRPSGFVQFQIDEMGKLGVLRLAFDDGQAYAFRREATQEGRAPDTPGAAAQGGNFAGLVDIGGGRKMYVECRGSGSPTVVLVSGLRGSAKDWDLTPKPAPTVFAEVPSFVRVCAYDRPGTPVGEQPSRSDPVPQPTTAGDAVADLHALLQASGEAGPYVLVGHSYGGLIVRLYASSHPEDVSGLVLVDALSEGLQDGETPEQWAVQRVLMEGNIAEGLALYPDLERIDPERSFEQVRSAAPLRPLPLLLLSADRPWGPQIPSMIAAGTLPADVPPDFGYVTDAAQKQAQERLGKLVPGAKHVTNTNSGHEIHKEQPQLVVDSIRDVVDTVRRQSADRP